MTNTRCVAFFNVVAHFNSSSILYFTMFTKVWKICANCVWFSLMWILILLYIFFFFPQVVSNWLMFFCVLFNIAETIKRVVTLLTERQTEWAWLFIMWLIVLIFILFLVPHFAQDLPTLFLLAGLFDFSPLCLFKCFLGSPTWLHFFLLFSAVYCVFKWSAC